VTMAKSIERMTLRRVHLPNYSSFAIQLHRHNPRAFRNCSRSHRHNVIRLRILTGGWAQHLATTHLSVIFRLHHLVGKGRSWPGTSALNPALTIMLHVVAAASGQPTSAPVLSPATNAPQHVRVPDIMSQSRTNAS
jgi:hypothetical protein